MIDVCPGSVGLRAEMIPVRGINHVLILQRRIAAGAFSDDVVRLDGAQRIVNIDLSAHAKRHGVEIRTHCLLLQRVEIKAGGAK